MKNLSASFIWYRKDRASQLQHSFSCRIGGRRCNKTIKPHLLKSLAGQFRILVFKIHFNLFKPNETLKLLYASKPCFTHQLVILPSNSACKECHLRYFHSSEDKTNYGLKAQPHEFFQTELDLPALKTHSYSTK